MYTLKKDYIPKHYDSVSLEYTVLHVDLGTYQGTTNHLKNVATASYHDYVRRTAKEIVNFVPLNKGAWHAGRIHNPSVNVEGNPNYQSYGLCYEGRGVDKNGKVSSDWAKVVDGQIATDQQVAMAAQRIIDVGMADKPIYAHVQLTSYKPPCVLDFARRVKLKIAELREKDQDTTCTLGRFTTQELFNELIKRFS